jgi:hypothetical protein
VAGYKNSTSTRRKNQQTKTRAKEGKKEVKHSNTFNLIKFEY